MNSFEKTQHVLLHLSGNVIF